jgi:tetratricopeptide (TPR) repeat protein
MRNAAISETEGSLGMAEFFANMPMVPETIAKFFVPVNFSTLPAFQTSATILGILVILGGGSFFLYCKRYFTRLTFFALCWFLVLMVPGMLYRPEFASYTYDTLDHRAYVICFGLLVMTLDVMQSAGWETRKFFWVAGAGVLIYLASVNYYFSRSYATPLAYAENALKSNPNSALAYFIRAVETYQKGDVDGALKDYARMLDVHPNDQKALSNRAIIYMKQKKYDQALADLDALIAVTSNTNAAAYSLRGQIREMRKDYDGAYKDFETAATLDPNERKNFEVFKTRQGQSVMAQVAALNKAGISEGKKGNYNEALRIFQKAIVLNPESYEIYGNIGNCQFMLGDREEACKSWGIAAKHGDRRSADMVARQCK